ncbi:unnamed protein product, partial [Closterium sp. NIES-53]
MVKVHQFFHEHPHSIPFSPHSPPRPSPPRPSPPTPPRSVHGGDTGGVQPAVLLQLGHLPTHRLRIHWPHHQTPRCDSGRPEAAFSNTPLTLLPFLLRSPPPRPPSSCLVRRDAFMRFWVDRLLLFQGALTAPFPPPPPASPAGTRSCGSGWTCSCFFRGASTPPSLSLPPFPIPPLLPPPPPPPPSRMVRRDAFMRFWVDRRLLAADMATQIFHVLKQDHQNYLVQDDFKPIMRELLNRHPGLEFLHDTPEFQERY